MRDAIRLATHEVNARGGIQGREVTLLELDEASQPEKAAAAAQKLVADAHVLGVIGTSDHESYHAVQPVFDKVRMPFLPAAIADRDLPAVGLSEHPAEFSVLPFGTSQMSRMAKYAWDVLGARTFVYVREDSNYGLALINHFRAAVSPLLKTIETGEEILRSDGDLPALVSKLKASPPQYIFYSGNAAQAAKLVTLLREAGVKSWFQAALHEPSQEYLDLAKDKAEGTLAVFPALPAEDFPAGRKFLEAYQAQGYADPPSRFGTVAYAEAQVLLAAMERSFLTRPSVAGALKNEQFDTVLGSIRFNFVGSSYQTAVIYQVTGGKWVPIKPAPAAVGSK